MTKFSCRGDTILQW